MMEEMPKYLDSIARQLAFATWAVDSLTGGILAEHDLTLPQWVSLTALWRTDGMTITNLNRYTKSTLPATSRLVGRMEEQGLVERKPDPNDRRVARVWLTEKSRKMHKLIEVFKDVNEMLLEGFSEAERTAIRGLLDRLAENANRHHVSRSEAARGV